MITKKILFLIIMFSFSSMVMSGDNKDHVKNEFKRIKENLHRKNLALYQPIACLFLSGFISGNSSLVTEAVGALSVIPIFYNELHIYALSSLQERITDDFLHPLTDAEIESRLSTCIGELQRNDEIASRQLNILGQTLKAVMTYFGGPSPSVLVRDLQEISNNISSPQNQSS